MGGTYAVFLNLRAGLALHEIELRWVTAGAMRAGVLTAPEWSADRAWGEVVAPEETDEICIAKTLSNHLQENYAGAIANVLCDKLCTNLMRYLPVSFPRLQLVHNISIGTYKAAASIRDHVHATVGVSPRIAADLVKQYGFAAETCVSVPNAVRDEFFVPREVRKPQEGPLKLLFLGRVENRSKGVFDLPELLRELGDCDVRLTVAGDGPDLPELKRRCRCFGEKVVFIGRVPYDQVADTLAQADVYIFPSRFEGFGISLAEAMAVGCVPVASRIRGVTDSIVDHEKTGFLFEIGNMREAANYVRQIAGDRDRLMTLASAGKLATRERFAINVVARQFAELLDQVQKTPRTLKAPLSLERWRYPLGLRSGLRTFLPEGLKAWLRLLREKAVIH
jgi:glycosyltransferase involved in cell wall biosynthesis